MWPIKVVGDSEQTTLEFLVFFWLVRLNFLRIQHKIDQFSCLFCCSESKLILGTYIFNLLIQGLQRNVREDFLCHFQVKSGLLWVYLPGFILLHPFRAERGASEILIFYMFFSISITFLSIWRLRFADFLSIRIRPA